MQSGLICFECMIKKQAKLARAQKNPVKGEAYLRDVLRIIADSPEGISTPGLSNEFAKAFEKYFHVKDRFAQVKKASNAYVIGKAENTRKVISAAEDPLLMALKFARVGNYIDFGALGDNVSNEELDALVAKAPEETVDPVEYQNFVDDLKKAKKLLYLTDNAGEVVFDKLFIEEIRRQFPELDVCVAVRGAPVLNDATMEDAKVVGLDEVARVIDNGIALAGTKIDMVGDALKYELDTADVILAKGMGNFETMNGCKLNVYYAFLCKCELFTSMFRVEKFTGMFLNDLRMKIYEVEGL